MGRDRGVEVIPDAGQVRRGRGSQAGQPGSGQGRLGTPRITGAARPLHETILDEAIHESGDPALGEQERIGEATHAKPAFRRLGQVEERLVLLEGQCVPAAKVIVEASGDAGMGAQERAPGPKVQVARSRAEAVSVGHCHHPTPRWLRRQQSAFARSGLRR